jgi:YggT family protein
MGGFLYFIIDSILGLLVLALILSAVLSWLVAFDVINLRNRFVYQVAHFLDAVTRPLLRPLQRVIPPLGSVDVTPIILILIIQGARGYLLPWAFAPLRSVLG